MGYDAFVKCNCYKEGKIAKNPSYEHYVRENEEGLWLDLKWETNKEKFQEFESWVRNNPCKHADMRLCSEHLANISGMTQFTSKIRDLGGSKYPTLSNHLPKSNDGFLAVKYAGTMLDELLAFDKETSNGFSYIVLPLQRLLHTSIQSGNPVIWT